MSDTIMRRNIGSRITQAARANAHNTALASRTRPSASTPRNMIPGNPAGLQRYKTARLEHTQGGYANPANQLARHANKAGSPLQVRLNRPYNSTTTSVTMNDTRTIRRQSGSAYLLSKLT